MESLLNGAKGPPCASSYTPGVNGPEAPEKDRDQPVPGADTAIKTASPFLKPVIVAAGAVKVRWIPLPTQSPGLLSRNSAEVCAWTADDEAPSQAHTRATLVHSRATLTVEHCGMNPSLRSIRRGSGVAFLRALSYNS